jgi:hypothetical protein
VYATQVNGTTYTFGSSGFLMRSNKLMYDRQTRTLWNHLTGQPVLGELAARDLRLKILPVVLTSWGEWKTQHPNTRVLDQNTGYARPYFPGAAYGDYYAAPNTMFPVYRRSRLLDPKARVFALQIGDVPKAYPLDLLARERVVNDTLNDVGVLIIATRGSIRVDGQNQRVGPVQYEAGREVRAFDRGTKTFRPSPTPEAVLDDKGQTWKITEEALVGPGGEQAPRLGGHLAYWFGWFAFYPKTLVYGGQP